MVLELVMRALLAVERLNTSATSRILSDDLSDPEHGERAASGGMYIDEGCRHFVTVKSAPCAIEPVIAHAMTLGCVADLPLPTRLGRDVD